MPSDNAKNVSHEVMTDADVMVLSRNGRRWRCNVEMEDVDTAAVEGVMPRR